MVIVGGNCSITGFDWDGEERFWTVSGDNVQALSYVDFDKDGIAELVAGSDDFAIRFFKGEEIVMDITERAKVQFLAPIFDQTFAYSLCNGAYGVYEGKKKLWKSRNKDLVTAICGIDMDYAKDGNKLMIVGFQSGQIEVRKHLAGDIAFTTKIDNAGSIAKIFYYDYRMSGQKQIVIVTTTGFIQGYNITFDLKSFDITHDRE